MFRLSLTCRLRSILIGTAQLLFLLRPLVQLPDFIIIPARNQSFPFTSFECE